MNADSKLRWVIDQNLLRAPGIPHEVYSLVATAFAEASEETKHQVWDAAYPDGTDIETADPRLAALLIGVDPDFEPAGAFLEVFQSKHPEWSPPDDPTFAHGVMEARRIQPRRLAPEQAVGLSYETVARLQQAEVGTERQYGLAEAIAAELIGNPVQGLDMLETAAEAEDWDSAVWQAASEALQRSGIDPENWNRTLMAYSGHPDAGKALELLSRAVVETIEKEGFFLTHDMASSMAIAFGGLLARYQEAGSDESDRRDDLMHAALNSWPGKVAQCFVEAAADQERAGAEPCATPGLVDFVSAVKKAGTSNWSLVATAALARMFPYLWERCPDLVKDTLLADFGWSDPDRASAVWQGMAYGVPSRQTIDALYGALPALAANLASLPDQASDALLNILAIIALADERHPIDQNGWLTELVRSSDDRLRSRFAWHIGSNLEALSEEQRSTQWDRWIVDWWNKRTHGFPTPIGREEASALLHWLPTLGARAKEAITLAVAAEVAPTTHGFLREFSQSTIPDELPDDALSLLAHVLGARDANWDTEDSLQILQRAVAKGAGNRGLTAVCEQFARLGDELPAECENLLDEDG